MTTKSCSKCGCEKPLTEFNRQKRYADGYDYQCRQCVKDYMAAYRAENRERVAAAQREWERANPDRVKAAQAKTREKHRDRMREREREWHAANPERSKEIKKAWKQKNIGKVNAATAKRRAGLEQRACLLTPEDEQKIKALYGFASYLSEKFGQPYHVDHIVPLYGETCSGLHHPDNLRVIPAQLNLSKSNKIDYELVPHAFRPDET